MKSYTVEASFKIFLCYADMLSAETPLLFGLCVVEALLVSYCMASAVPMYLSLSKVTTIHPNLRSVLLISTLHATFYCICRSIALLYAFGILQRTGHAESDVLFIVIHAMMLWSIWNNEGLTLSVLMERLYATTHASTYEKKHPGPLLVKAVVIPVLLQSTMAMVLSTLGTPFSDSAITPVLPQFLIMCTEFCLTVPIFFVMWRANAIKLRVLKGRYVPSNGLEIVELRLLHRFGMNRANTLDHKYQLRENMRVFRILARCAVLGTIMGSVALGLMGVVAVHGWHGPFAGRRIAMSIMGLCGTLINTVLLPVIMISLPEWRRRFIAAVGLRCLARDHYRAHTDKVASSEQHFAQLNALFWN